MYIIIICHWAILHYSMSFKTIAGRSDGVFWWFPALYEDEGKICLIHQNYLVALNHHFQWQVLNTANQHFGSFWNSLHKLNAIPGKKVNSRRERKFLDNHFIRRFISESSSLDSWSYVCCDLHRNISTTFSPSTNDCAEKGYCKGTGIWQTPVFRHLRALQINPWKFIIWMNEL